MFCAKCGAEVKGNFCAKCGTKVEQTPVTFMPETQNRPKNKIWIPIVAAVVTLVAILVVVLNVTKVRSPEKVFKMIEKAVRTGNTSKIAKLDNKKVDESGADLERLIEGWHEGIIDECGVGYTLKCNSSSGNAASAQQVARASANLGIKIDSMIQCYFGIEANGPEGNYKGGTALTLYKSKGSWYVTDVFPSGG